MPTVVADIHPVLAPLSETRVIAVLVLNDGADAAAVGRALAAGGLQYAEVALRTPTAVGALSTLAAETDLVIGAGTVLDRHHVDVALTAGAQFIVSPGLSRGVVEHCQQVGVPLLPGVSTATELMAARDHGMSTVKFFPADQVGGAAAVKALSAPFGSTRFVPTGGITAATMLDYLALPSVLAIGGSWLADQSLVDEGGWAEITARTASAVAAATGAATGRANR